MKFIVERAHGAGILIHDGDFHTVESGALTIWKGSDGLFGEDRRPIYSVGPGYWVDVLFHTDAEWAEMTGDDE